ncbi:MAG: hypothetical protein ACI8WT_001380 [Clostridium sp.]|jgi:hypothetical protein
MATMIPDLSETQLSEIDSSAEVKVYKALKNQLSENFIVFFEVAWILKKENGDAKDGETDFIICHPSYGYLCIEVKGGGISFDATSNQWYSTDRYKKSHTINNPIKQALKAKYSIRSKINEYVKYKGGNFPEIDCGHALFFPDICDASSLILPNMHLNLIGTSESLSNIEKWIKECFEFWRKNSKATSTLGQGGVEILKDIFAKSFSVEPLISSRLKDQETIRLQLTNQQMVILNMLSRQRQAVVSGGAGTGKTVMAVEKAKRLAKEGFNTLLICYNRPLADYLAKICIGIDGLCVMSFHQLCYKEIEEARMTSGRDLLQEAKRTYPGESEYDIQLPNALACSIEINPFKYEAIVCDEGQDFREEFWLPLDLLMEDSSTSPLYIFYDNNQNIYSRVSTFPISGNIYPLSINCRNTMQIHNASYKYYVGEPVMPSKLNGLDLQFQISNNLEKQAVKINTVIVNLIIQDKVEANNISVLIVDAKYKNDYFGALEKLPLPRGIRYIQNEQMKNNNIILTTVNKFKGLESEIVFLWGMDYIDVAEFRELLYVGLSRAKSIVYIVGSPEICSKFQLV